MHRQLKKCPRTGVWCCLCDTAPDVPCLAERAYDMVLDGVYPHVNTLPIGLESRAITRSIQKVICKHIVRRHIRIRKELREL